MKTLLTLLFFLTACSPEFSRKFWHDETNPCTYGQYYYNKEECERWKEREPREYARYVARIQRSKII
jgi:hypothetical protein